MLVISDLVIPALVAAVAAAAAETNMGNGECNEEWEPR